MWFETLIFFLVSKVKIDLSSLQRIPWHNKRISTKDNNHVCLPADLNKRLIFSRASRARAWRYPLFLSKAKRLRNRTSKKDQKPREYIDWKLYSMCRKRCEMPEEKNNGIMKRLMVYLRDAYIAWGEIDNSQWREESDISHFRPMQTKTALQNYSLFFTPKPMKDSGVGIS